MFLGTTHAVLYKFRFGSLYFW